MAISSLEKMSNSNPPSIPARTSTKSAKPSSSASQASSSTTPPIPSYYASSDDETKANQKFGPVLASGSNKGKADEVFQFETTRRGEHAKSRCVYNYEDKYRFSRILSSDCLVFDSHFESGNLLMANRVQYGDARDKNLAVQEYDLFLHHDLHSLGHNQWFYFSVGNTAANTRVKFNIVNLGKPDSLYNNGMRPLMYSQCDATEGTGWQRKGEKIVYYCNKTAAPTQKGREANRSRSFYTLTFTHTFGHSNDVCFFAMCYPYTFSDLQHYLYKLQLDEKRRFTFRRELLCRTLANNECTMLTITNQNISNPKTLQRRLGIILTARVHPGESNASWIMHGIIDFLTSDHPKANDLRNKFVFKVVPMLNPDGGERAEGGGGGLRKMRNINEQLLN